jgi:4-hydroxy-tetrahydrodipicolinate synthase
MTGVGAVGTVITAIVTPFTENGAVDEDTFVSLLQYLAEHGSDGFVVCGTTGEAATLADDEHLRVLELAVQERPKGTTIIGGTGSNDTAHAVHMTQRATELGVDATLSVTPYYNKPNRRGIKAHYEAIAQATDKPIVLYNIPGRTATNMPPDLLEELAQIENVTGVKQANGDELQPLEGLEVYAGDDANFARCLDFGGAGGILVASHVVGDEMRRMVDEPDNRAAINESLQDVYKTLFLTSSPTCTKAALTMLGLIPGEYLRLPMVPADDAERDAVRSMLERHGLLETAAR